MSPQKMAETILALSLLLFSLLSIFRFGRVNTAQQRLLIRVAIVLILLYRAISSSIYRFFWGSKCIKGSLFSCNNTL